MTITNVGVGPTTSQTTTATLTSAMPSGYAADDLLIWVTCSWSATQLTAPVGWTLIGMEPSRGTSVLYAFRRIATGTSADIPTQVMTAAGNHSGRLFAFRGSGLRVVSFKGKYNSASVNAHETPGALILGNEGVVIRVAATGSSVTPNTYTWPTGIGIASNVSYTTSGGYRVLGTCIQNIASPSAVPAVTSTFSAANYCMSMSIGIMSLGKAGISKSGVTAKPTKLGTVAKKLILGSSLTNGSGGAFSDSVSTYVAPMNGYSSGVRIYAAGLDTNKPLGLLVHFPGDGAFEYDNPDSAWMLGGVNGIRAQAKSRNLICVIANSPQTDGNRTWWEWSGSAENPTYARDLILSLYAKYNIDRRRVFLTGYSGGSQFLVKHFLTRFSGQIFGGGGVIVFGGGGEPDVAVTDFTPAFPAMVPLHWCTGELDDGTEPDSDGYNALASATAGRNWYQGRQCRVSMENPVGYGHDLDGLFGPVVGQQLDLML